MQDDKTKPMFISYDEEDNTRFEGIVNVIEVTDGWVVIDTGKNILRIPNSKVNKLKEKKEVD